jgi:hypothetical protein
MAALANTYKTTEAKGQRESLADMIFDTSPDETPFLSAAGRGDASARQEDWQTDVLGSPDTANAHVEGDDISAFQNIAPTVRVSNMLQISRKAIILSDTIEEVDKAGRRSELAYQLPRRGSELKIDLEAMGLENIAGDGGSATTPRIAAGIGAWLKSNTDFAGDGGDPVYTSGVPSAVRTDGTPRAFTETMLQDVAESLWLNGGKIRNLFVGPFNKRAVSNFAGVVTRNFDMSNVDPSPTAVIAAVDVYVTDYGSLKVIPSRWQRDRDALFLDFDMIEYRFLRDFRTVKLAKTGDAEKRMLVTEWTLVIKNEVGLGGVFDLTTV